MLSFIFVDEFPVYSKQRNIFRVFSEVPFWNSAEYGILYGIGFISRNSAKFFTVQFRGIPCRFVYTEFRIPSNENTYPKLISYLVIWFHIRRVIRI
jgi:hypothetical protein